MSLNLKKRKRSDSSSSFEDNDGEPIFITPYINNIDRITDNLHISDIFKIYSESSLKKFMIRTIKQYKNTFELLRPYDHMIELDTKLEIDMNLFEEPKMELDHFNNNFILDFHNILIMDNSKTNPFFNKKVINKGIYFNLSSVPFVKDSDIIIDYLVSLKEKIKRSFHFDSYTLERISIIDQYLVKYQASMNHLSKTLKNICIQHNVDFNRIYQLNTCEMYKTNFYKYMKSKFQLESVTFGGYMHYIAYLILFCKVLPSDIILEFEKNIEK